jgi:hypothetical protein
MRGGRVAFSGARCWIGHEHILLGSTPTPKVRENNKKQNRAEVENSVLKRKQRAGSKVDGKKTEAKIYI